MSRFRIDHPSRADLYIEAGHDHMLGFFIEMFREGRDRPIKSLDFFTTDKPVTLNDIFEFMIANGFTTREDLEAAIVFLQDGEPEHLPSGVARAVEVVVMGFKQSAD